MEPTVTKTKTQDTEEANQEEKPVDMGLEAEKLERAIGAAILESNGQYVPWVETHPAVIAALSRTTKIPQDFMTYKNCYITGYGRSEEIEARINRPLTEILHGPSEGKVIGRDE